MAIVYIEGDLRTVKPWKDPYLRANINGQRHKWLCQHYGRAQEIIAEILRQYDPFVRNGESVVAVGDGWTSTRLFA